MIAADQPTIFNSDVVAALSSTEDGSMRFGNGDDEAVTRNRQTFLQKVGISPMQTTLVQVTYDNVDDFTRYAVVNDSHKSEGVLQPVSRTRADALVTTASGHALFLPIADCVGVILHDSEKSVLMVSHVGRHSAVIDGAKRSVQYLKSQFQSVPSGLKVWLSPAVGAATYPIYARDNKGLREIILKQLIEAGVDKSNIEASLVDTASSPDYFSHSQFVVGRQIGDGRHTVVAMMR